MEKSDASDQANNGLAALQKLLKNKPICDMLFVGKRQDANKLLQGLTIDIPVQVIGMRTELQTLKHRWTVGLVYHALDQKDWPASQHLLSQLREVY